MPNPQHINEHEHETILKAAKEALKQSRETNKMGKERLENALKKYKERSNNEFPRNI